MKKSVFFDEKTGLEFQIKKIGIMFSEKKKRVGSFSLVGWIFRITP